MAGGAVTANNKRDNHDPQAVMGLAMAGSFTMIAHQVASKAARDGFFLQQFDPSDLPKMVVSAALLSFLLAIVFSRGNERFGPARTIPISFAVSGLLHVVEWMLAPVLPRPVAVAIYLHVVGLGAILLSGFWLLLSEVFDLREAKKRFGRIAGFGTAGGIAGGLLAERLVAWSLGDYMLVVLGGFHVICAGIAWRLKPLPTSQKKRQLRPRGKETSAAEAFRQTPLLWQLAALVFLGTCTAALLDYLFKLGATLSIGKGPGLVRYFAVFYTACQVLTFLLQTFLAKPAVEWLGVSRSVATLPVAVGLGSTVALLVPVYPLVALLRGIEVVLRGSLFRSGYEFLYTPVPPSDKRAVKTIIDVGFDRLGDAAGAGAVQIMVWLGPQLARPEILGLGMVLTTISATLALRLEGSYRGVLERGLVERAREEEDSAAEETGGTHRSERDESLMNTVFEGLPSFSQMPAVKEPPPKHPSETNENLDTLTPEAAKSVPVAAPKPAPVVVEKPRIQDPSVERLLELRSRNAKRVVAALTDGEPFDPLAVPQVIRLLAWDEVSAAARQYLERGGKRIAGQINDALTDQDVDFAIRRRLPRLLARVASQQSVDGLVNALNDPRFEIRYQCGRALEYMKRHCENLDFHDRAVMAAAERELTVNQAIWSSRQKTTVLHDSDGGDSGGYDFLDDVLRERANRSLEHVFSLFAVVLPRDPLMAAFRALHQEDRMFRGLALEYLESVIPEEIRKRLWTVLEETPPPEAETKEAREQMMALLLETNAERLLRVKKASS